MPNKKTKLAIFDIDGTIFRSSLVVELINGMVEMGVFSQLAKHEMEREYLAWVNRKGEYEDYINKVVQIHLKYIAGHSVEEVDKVAQLVVRYQKDRVYRFTRDLLKRLKKQNYYLLAISGSPTYIVSKFAKHFGFNAFFGSQYEAVNKTYTGSVLNLDSVRNKSKVVFEYVAERGLKVDYKNSIAVGDTDSDITMLELVGKPIAFNPNSRLASYAKKHEYRIVLERKDVIYDLRGYKFLG